MSWGTKTTVDPRMMMTEPASAIPAPANSRQARPKPRRVFNVSGTAGRSRLLISVHGSSMSLYLPGLMNCDMRNQGVRPHSWRSDGIGWGNAPGSVPREFKDGLRATIWRSRCDVNCSRRVDG
jgi:hypothetical protein